MHALRTHRTMLTAGLLVAWAGLACAGPADAPPVDPHMGQYVGVCRTGGGLPAPATAMVIGKGKGTHRIVLHAQTAPPTHRELVSGPEGFEEMSPTGRRFDGRLSYTTDDGKVFELTRVGPHSPTEGAPPPEGATVLLAYDPNAPAEPGLEAWTGGTWQPMPDGSVRAGKGDLRTKESFGDCRLHVEFRVPYMPDKRGQARGNSGVYLQDRYEVQVLDSFGLAPRDNRCGGIYKVSAPRGNASFAPGRWQTYDILFRAPRFDADGKVTVPARVTVRHNGVLIHENQPIPRPTGGGRGDIAPTGPLKLQDHGNPVRYRNIWLLTDPS